MVFRSTGVYLLTGSALYSQTRTAYHVAKMDALAAESAALTLVANGELEASLEMQSKSAIDSEEGLALQTESAELEIEAEREFAKAAAETALGEEYSEEAEMLHEKAAKDALESEATITHAEEMEIQSEQLHLQAEKDRVAATIDEENSVALLEEAAKAEEMATGAEEKAAEYEVIALKREGQSIKDGEALLRAEAGAMEDAEAMVACAPIPILNVVCEAVGSLVEAGYQGIAAFEGAKSAVETISAVTAQRKEHAEIVIAIEQQEEAARLAIEAEEFQGLAEEESGKAVLEEGESDAAGVEAGESQVLGEEKLKESEEEEALAALDEEKAAEEYAQAARDEGIAIEEESSAIASQVESEELLAESTSEEFEALAERSDGERKEVKAGNLMKQSIGHGIHALGIVLNAVVTAGLVIYIVLMRGLTKVVAPSIVKVWKGESTITATHVMQSICGFLMHVGVVMGSISSMQSILSNLENIPAPLRIRALFIVALLASVIESLAIHSTYAACSCHMKGLDVRSTMVASILAFFSKLFHLVPVVMMELLVITVIFGFEIFHTATILTLNPVWIWGVLAMMMCCISLGVIISTRFEGKSTPEKSSTIEGEFLFARIRQAAEEVPCEIDDQEYGTMEEVSLLTEEVGSTKASSSKSATSTCDPNAGANCLQRCKQAITRYFHGLRLSSDLLVLSLMGVLLWNCWPTLRLLHPLVKETFAMLTYWVSMPVLIAVALVLLVVVHLIYVR